MNADARTWQELLAEIIRDPQERQRIARELGVSTVTLSRWTSSVSTPRPQNIRFLLRVLPEYRAQLAALLADEFSDSLVSDTRLQDEDMAETISPVFYNEVLRVYQQTDSPLRLWAICNLVLSQMLRHLDAPSLGMYATILRLLPSSSEGKVRSLRDIARHGTLPWSKSLEELGNVLMGSESLAGHAVMAGRSTIIQDTQEEHLCAAMIIEQERSAAAFPLFRAGRVAGCLLVSSTQPFFFSPSRTSALDAYASLLALAFADADFKPLSGIDFGAMPFYAQQQPVLATLRQRMRQIQSEAIKKGKALSHEQMEQRAWQEIEEELLRANNL